MLHKIAGLLLFVAVAALLAGCDDVGGSNAKNPPEALSFAPRPDLAIHEISQGGRVELARYTVPGKFTIFDFYSEGCPPCRDLKPKLEGLAKRNDRIVLRIVNINRKGAGAIDWKSPVARQFGIQSLPYLKIYDETGTLVAKGDNALAWVRTADQTVKAKPPVKKDLPPGASTANRLVISNGERVDLKAYLVAGKYTLFDFFSPYCGPCMEVKPSVEKLADEDPEVAVRFVNINRPNVRKIDVESPVTKQYPSIFPIPHFKLFDKKGVLISEGDAAWDWYEARVAKLKVVDAPEPVEPNKTEDAKKKPVPVKEITRGARVDLAKHAVKGKFTIFDFYSVACRPCVQMKPEIERLAEKNPDIVLRVVNINRPGIVSYIDVWSPVARQYNINTIPQFKVFDKDGKLMLERDEAFYWVQEQLFKTLNK